MSIAELCTGDTVIAQSRSTTASVGAAGGDSREWSDRDTFNCLIQGMSSSESLRFASRGMAIMYVAFFSADPEITENDLLKWTVRASETLTTPIYLRVLSVPPVEGPPGESQLWIVYVGQETQRPER